MVNIFTTRTMKSINYTQNGVDIIIMYSYPSQLEKQRLEKLGYILKDTSLNIDEGYAH